MAMASGLGEKEWSESLVRELNQEIHGLRAENSELKFHLYLHLPELVVGDRGRGRNLPPPGPGALFSFTPSPPSKSVNVKDVGTSTSIRNQVKGPEQRKHPDSPCTRCGNGTLEKMKEKEIVKLQKELENAEKVIADLKLVKINQTEKAIHQEIKVLELENEIRHLQSTGLEIFSLQIPPPISPTSRDPHHPTSGIQYPFIPANSCAGSPTTTPTFRSNSSSSSFGSGSRRGSTQSLLPEDYKSSVSSLPPIGAQDLLLNKFKTLGIQSQNTGKMSKFRPAPLPIPGSISNTANVNTSAPTSVNHSHARPLKAGHKL